MRKLFFILSSLFALTIGALLLLPSMMDWNQYRGDIAREASRVVGRDVVIAGDISAQLIPVPALEAADVSVANRPGGEAKNMVQLSALSIRISPLALLTGTVKVSSVQLVEPVIVLEVFPDGVGNWAMGTDGDGADQGQAGQAADAGQDGQSGGQNGGQNGEAGQQPVADDGGAGVGVTIDDFSIENGTLIYRDLASGDEKRIEGLNGRLSAGSLTGPFEAEGNLAFNGLPLAFEAKVGQWVEGQPLAVNLSADLGDDKGSLAMQGRVTPAAEGVSAEGQLKASAANLRQLLALFAGKDGLPQGLAQSMGFEAQLVLTPAELTLSGLSLKLGDSDLSGGATVALTPTINANIQLKSNQVNLDPFLVAAPATEKSQETAPKPADKPAAGKQTPKAQADQKQAAPVSLPEGMTVNATLEVAALKMRGDAIRQARVDITAEGQAVTVKAVQAVLPGESGVSLAGRFDLTANRFDGGLRFESRNLSQLLDWTGAVPAGVLLPGRPKVASLTAEFSGDAAQASVKSFALKLDQSDLSGAATIRMGSRLGLGANIRFKRLDLDAMLPGQGNGKAKPQAKQAAPEGGGKASDPSAAFAGLAALNGFDANVKVEGDLLIVQGRRVNGIKLDATIQNGKLTLRQAVAKTAGVALSANGILSGFGGVPTAAPFQIGIGTGDFQRLLDLGQVKLAGPPPKLGKTTITVKMQGGVLKPNVNAVVKTGGGAATLNGTLDLLNLQKGLTAQITLRHPNLPGLMRRVGVDYRAGKKAGGINLKAEVAYSPAEIAVRKIGGALGKTKLSGNVTYKPGGRPYVAVNLGLGTLDLNPYLAGGGKKAAPKDKQAKKPAAKGGRWSRDPLPLAWMDSMDMDLKLKMGALTHGAYTIRKLSLTGQLKGGVLTVKSLTGVLFDGPVNAAGSMNGKSGDYQLRVSYDKGNLAKLSQALSGAARTTGQASMKADLGGRGLSELAIVSTLSGKGDLVMSNVRPGSNAKGGLTEVLTLMSGPLGGGGGETVANLSAPFVAKKGVFDINPVQIKANVGNGKARAVVDLPRWLIDARGTMRLAPNVVTALVAGGGKEIVVPFDVSGPLDRPTPNVDLSALKGLPLPGGVEKLIPNLGGGGGGKQPGAQQGQPSVEQQLLDQLLKVR